MRHIFLKLTALTLALLFCLSLALPAVLAEDAEPETFQCGAYDYTLLDDGTAKIIRYYSNGPNLIIPETLDGHPVTGLGDMTFSFQILSSFPIPGLEGPGVCESLQSVTLPDSLLFLEGNPFRSCENLSAFVVSPDHPVFAVLDGALIDKTTQTLLCYPPGKEETIFSVPEGVEKIGEEAFFCCDKLTDVILPDSVAIIGRMAFANCKGLTGLAIPDSVVTIEADAFYLCESLAGVSFADGNVKMENNPFTRCPKLAAFSVSPDHLTLCVIDGALIDKASNTLICYPPGKEETDFSVPQGVKKIGDEAFFCCARLTDVILPDGVTAIGAWAFQYCSGLIRVSLPGSITEIGACAFASCMGLKEIALPDGLEVLGDHAFDYCTGLTEITLPASVRVFGEDVFSLCYRLTRVSISDGASSIGDGAFRLCVRLTDVSIPDSVESIGRGAFVGCEALTSLSIPDSVTLIGENAFYGCDSLTVNVGRNSCAERYCIDNGIKYTYFDSLEERGP